MRVQFTLGDRMVEKLDALAEEIGMTRSAACTFLVTQGLLSFEHSKKALGSLPEAIVEAIRGKDE